MPDLLSWGHQVYSFHRKQGRSFYNLVYLEYCHSSQTVQGERGGEGKETGKRGEGRGKGKEMEREGGPHSQLCTYSLPVRV